MDKKLKTDEEDIQVPISALPKHNFVNGGYFQIMYDPRDLRYLQDFDSEHYKVMKRVTNENNLVRYVLIGIMAMVILLKLYVCGV